MPSAILAAGIAFSILLLAAQFLRQVASNDFVRIHVQIKHFMTDSQLARDLLRTPLQTKQYIQLAHGPRLNRTRTATAMKANQRPLTRLIGLIAITAFVASKFAADRAFMAPKLLSNLCDALIGFHDGVTPISFDLAKVFVIHRASSTGQSRRLEC